MMDSLKPQDYLELFPNDERQFFKTLLHQWDTSPNLQTHNDQLKTLLALHPYPVLQILQLCKTKSRFTVNSVIEETIKLFIDDEKANNSKAKFINFIANLPLSALEASSIQYSLIDSLASQSQNDKLCLALLCRPEANLLMEVLKTFEAKLKRFDFEYTKEFITHNALTSKLHFVPLLSLQMDDLKECFDVATRSNLLILKIVNEFANTSKSIADIGNIKRMLQAFDVSELPQDLEEIHKFFYADFQRLHLIMEFLKRFPDNCKNITVETLLNSHGILRLLFEYDINASFDETLRLIGSLYKWEIQMPTRCIRDLETETLTYYFVLSTVFDIILVDSSLTTEHYLTSKIQKLNAMLRQMRNIDVLCSLIEDIFQLIFLRWENMQCDSLATTEFQVNRSTSAKSSNSNSTDGNDDQKLPTPVIISSTSPGPTRHGFICRGRALHCIFSFLKNFVTKKLHSEEYKHASERIQMRFQRIIDIIGEALWKYSVIEKIDDSIERSGIPEHNILGAEELLQLVQMHVDAMEKYSSDDESRDRCNYASLTRRKAAKKRRRATFSGVVAAPPKSSLTMEQCRTRASIMVASVSELQGADPVIQLKARNLIARLKTRSIIPRMLGSPENLAIMALAINNFNDVKYIIETFNLHNTELDNELSFVEQQQQVKQKLSTIYSNYQQEERNSSNRDQLKATVEQIKNVVAKGFEASKIISVIDNFAQAQKINQSPEIKQLLAKHSKNPQYGFLRQYDECNLNGVIITDLVLNLPFNHEITTNILMVIKRQQQLGVVSTTYREDPNLKMQLPKDIGCTPLLENLCQCMRLLDSMSLCELLSDNYHSLKPRVLGLELERERAFMSVFNKNSSEFGRCADLKAHLQSFQNLQAKNNYYNRFIAYVNQLSKLLQLRDRNCEFHTSELLKFDPCDIIGELLFEHNMTPLEIEANVSALNLNLVHVIALNICPEISGKTCTISKAASKLKQQTIFNYIWNHNRLLAYLLQGIDNPGDLAMEKNMQPVFLQRFLNFSELRIISDLFGGNALIAALRADNIDISLLKGLDSKMKQLEILLLKFGIQDPKNKELIDDLIVDLIQHDTKNIHLAVHINDIGQKAVLIYDNFTKIATTRLAKELIETTLQHKEVLARVPQQLRLKLEDTLADITIYAKVSEVLQFETWPQAYDFGLKTPNTIFERLLQLHLYKLCYKWCKVVKLSRTFAQHKKSFFSAILEALLDYNDQPEPHVINTYLLQIMESFPEDDCYNFLNTHKDSFRSVELLKYVVGFLSERARSDHNYMNYKISLIIFEHLSPGEREKFWKLFKYPLLIIEQLIMNTKFEILAKVLKAVRLGLNACVENVGKTELCSFCFDKRGNIYDIQTKAGSQQNKVHFQLGSESSSSKNSTFILLNFNLYQKDHIISNDCIDLLLRIYATKALDYQMSDSAACTEPNSQSTDMQQSLDSLCGAFQMPKEAPSREDWVRDEEAAHCMCCRRAVFTMLMRRHHCRRCGRVVCFACSTYRMNIPELYADVEVRICNDCHNFIEEENRKSAKNSSEKEVTNRNVHVVSTREQDSFKWKLSGNITHDKLLREEFCYDHAPSVGLCLSILSYHLDQKKCVDLLLYHCRKLEKLIVPSPEVDYELISKMMNCLALAAKVRGGSAEIETFCEHSEVIISLVQNGCESLIPAGPLNNHSIRKLADSLVQAEKWELALEVHLKYGIPTTGVMAAHGLSCLRAGCFDTAREKLSHCMPKLSSELANSRISNFILTSSIGNDHTTGGQLFEFNRNLDIPPIKRPQRGPALLVEILKIIQSIASTKPQPETLHRASIIRNSNTSLSSLISRRKDTYVIPMHEPALNVLTTLANLKRLAKGNYNEGTVERVDNRKQLRRQSRNFEEALHYVLTYGSHADVIQFLMCQHELSASLKYFVVQNLDADLFIHNIFLVSLRCGMVPTLIEKMLSLDDRLQMWRDVLMQTCRYLENKNLLNSLYQLQILLMDPIRASMTCVKFYSMNCENFQQLHSNAQHLHNAHKHLMAELESTQWENINLERTRRRKDSLVRRSSATSGSSSTFSGAFPMQMDGRSLNSHINTILKQLDVAKFLANCERGRVTDGVLVTDKILQQIRIESGRTMLPTLFDSTQDKIQICILILLSGKNIEEGFGLTYSIIHDYKLPSMKIFGATAKYLARNQRISEVEKLINCITGNNGTSNREIDEILSIAIHSACGSHEPEVKVALDNLAKKIHSVELRLSCHIFMGQLKSAYLLANKYERLSDIRKILRQAEISNQVHIKKLCEKKLNINQPLS